MATKLQNGNIPCLATTSSEPRPTVLMFDSGVGGLLVYDEIRHLLPDLYYIHVSDNVVFPYGEKSEVFIVERVVEIITAVQERYLLALAAIACNTTSIVLLPTLHEKSDFPVVSIVPMIKLAVCLTANGTVGLLVTCGTVKRSYTHRLIARLVNECQIEVLGSAEMVELAGAKLHGENVPLDALKRILRSWLKMREPPDIVVLGCTHFPLLQEELLQVLPEGIRLVDSGTVIARRTAWLLEHEAPDAKSVDANIAFCTAMTPEVEQLLSVLQRYGFETLEKLVVLG